MPIMLILQHAAFRRVALGIAGGGIPYVLNYIYHVGGPPEFWELVAGICLGGFTAFLFEKETDLLRLAIVGACAPSLMTGFITNGKYATALEQQARATVEQQTKDRPKRPAGQAPMPYGIAPAQQENSIEPILRRHVLPAQIVPVQLAPVSADKNFCYGPPTLGSRVFAALFARQPLRIWITSRQSYRTREAAQEAIAEINKLQDLKNVSLPTPSILQGTAGYILVYVNGAPYSNMSDELRQFAQGYSSKMAPWIQSSYPLVLYDEDYMNNTLVKDKVVAPCAT